MTADILIPLRELVDRVQETCLTNEIVFHNDPLMNSLQPARAALDRVDAVLKAGDSIVLRDDVTKRSLAELGAQAMRETGETIYAERLADRIDSYDLARKGGE